MLKKNNIKFTAGVAGYGVVALIEFNNPSSQVIGLRADMDALPIQEKKIFHINLLIMVLCMLVVMMLILL